MTMTWRCEVCGYIHHGPEPPDICPVCGAPKEMFTPFDLAPAEAPVPPAATQTAMWRCPICTQSTAGEAPPAACPVCGAGGHLLEPWSPPPPAGAGGEGLRLVILGAGVAGMTAAEQARSLAPQAQITVVSGEPGLPYYRLNLTRLLAGEIGERELVMQDEGWFAERRIDLLHGEVVAIDRPGRRVRLQEGGDLPYDRLVLALGAHAFVPPLPGAALTGVFTERTLEDARAILREARPGRRCVCIGGGLLGLESAAALLAHGVEVTVLEGYGWLLPRQLPEPGGRLVARHLEGLGLRVICGARVEGIEQGAGGGGGDPATTGAPTSGTAIGTGAAAGTTEGMEAGAAGARVAGAVEVGPVGPPKPGYASEARAVPGAKEARVTGAPGAALAVRLGDGTRLAADFVLLAAGVRPNSHLARNCGLETRAGVLVDDRMASSDPDIFAAGDLAEHLGILHGLWPAAYAQGLVAGANAAGGRMSLPALAPSSRLKVVRLDVFSIGDFQPPDSSYDVHDLEEAGSWSRFVCHDGALVGAALVGDTSLAPAVKEAVEKGLQVVELAATEPGARLAALCGRLPSR